MTLGQNSVTPKLGWRRCQGGKIAMLIVFKPIGRQSKVVLHTYLKISLLRQLGGEIAGGGFLFFDLKNDCPMYISHLNGISKLEFGRYIY